MRSSSVDPPRSDRQRSFGIIAGGMLLVAAAVLLVDCGVLVPPQGWSERWGPLVPHRTFPGDCGICHVPERWDVLREDFEFDHEERTGFRLAGAHATAACLRCHNDRGPVQAYLVRGCGGCHADPHKSTLGLDCSRCHGEDSWAPTGLVAEHARTRFPLVGAHLAAPCERCHEQAPVGDFRGAPTDCDLCHRDDAKAARSPDHAAAGWLTGCEDCHTPSGWGGANFVHRFFPLTGGHGGLDCSRCHTGGVFTGLSADCYSCHQDDYQGAPNHVSGGFSTDCLRCHGRNSWSGADFSHEFFALTGGHGGLECSRCHVGGVFTGLSPACFSCHQDDYQRAADHVTLSFPTNCESCHTIQRWTGASFSHRFPLRGPHDEACSVCHQGTTSTFTCLVCHDHSQSRMDDKHSEVRNYRYDSQACYSCHRNGRGD